MVECLRELLRGGGLAGLQDYLLSGGVVRNSWLAGVGLIVGGNSFLASRGCKD